MTTKSQDLPITTFGTGIYSFPQAAAIIGRHGDAESRKLRSWMDSGLTPATHDEAGEPEILSFHDLVSLEVVRRFRAEKVSLQKVRKVEAALRERHPELLRPFAHRLFFTDGASVWVDVNGVTEEVIGNRPNQVVFQEIISTFAREIRYEHDRAVAWDISEWIEIDPTVQFGAPVVRGTRVTVDTIVENLEVGTPQEVADWYGLSIRQVDGVAQYATAA